MYATSLQQGQMVEVENGQFLVDDAVNRRVQLQAFLAVRSAARFGNELISPLVVEAGIGFGGGGGREDLAREPPIGIPAVTRGSGVGMEISLTPLLIECDLI